MGLSKEPPFKTVASMMLGFGLGAVGLDQMTGQLRLTFGVDQMLNGFDFLIAVIGLFGIGEILLTMEEGLSFRGKIAKLNMKVVLQTWKELPRYWMLYLRSCVTCPFRELSCLCPSARLSTCQTRRTDSQQVPA